MTSKQTRMIRIVSLCVAAAMAAAVQAAAPPEEILIPGEKVFPESLTSTVDGTVIIGSLGARTIFRAKSGSASAEPWIKPDVGILGVLADDKSNTLYACAGGIPAPGAAPPVATLHTFDLKSGAAKAQYKLPTAGAACNDIAVGADGTAYVTDTSNMQVVRLKKGAKELEVWAGNGDAFGPKGGVLDGIAVLGDRVLVNTLLTSKLFSVSIGKDGSAGEVARSNSIARSSGRMACAASARAACWSSKVAAAGASPKWSST